MVICVVKDKLIIKRCEIMQKKALNFLVAVIFLGVTTFANAAGSIRDINGSWLKPCSYDPVPGEKAPKFSIVKATLNNAHVNLERNNFTDASCTNPWKLFPTVLWKGTYRQLSKKDIIIGGKPSETVQIVMNFTHVNNGAKLEKHSKFSVYFNGYDKIYVGSKKKKGAYDVFSRNDEKAKTAGETFKQKKGAVACVVTLDVPNISANDATFCLENVSFPEEQFKAYCKASAQNSSLKFALSCPSFLHSHCDYGFGQLGYKLKRWYSDAEIKMNPYAKKACETTLRGKWHD